MFARYCCRIAYFIGPVVWITSRGAIADEVSTATMLREIVSVDQLSAFPDPPFTCRQFSSYDRDSTTPQDERSWFANADTDHFLRTESRQGRSEHVLMDAEGPGAIVRIWSANPQGTLRVYLDGAGTPALEVPLADWLDGSVRGAPQPLAGTRSRGWNSYYPIPYARRCKVTCDRRGFYYHVNYRTYPAGTRVRSFTSDQLAANHELATEIAAHLLAPPTGRSPNVQQRATKHEDVLPGKKATLAKLSSTAQIDRLAIQLSAEDLPRALRQTLLKIAFDGHETVAAPLGDFFGSAPGVNPYTSLLAGVNPDGSMWCRWPMPFHEQAVVRIANHGDQPVNVKCTLDHMPIEWTRDTLYFHAKWRSARSVPTRPFIDWNYLTARGRGVFVGTTFSIANPVRQWWGEGDEKIYVDGEPFPSTFGTGTEDYFGYAWCSNEPFQHAFHNQTRCDGPANFGNTSLNRWHVLDRIPFAQSMRFDMELWHWHERAKVDMSVVAYWYADARATDGFEPISPEDLAWRPLAPYAAPRVAGAVEAEELSIVEIVGDARPQEWPGLSNDHQLWWHGGHAIGDRLTLAFDLPADREPGPYRVAARFLTGPDYGIHRVLINDVPIAPPIDFFSPQVRPTAELPLTRATAEPGDSMSIAAVQLEATGNRITFEALGANRQAVPALMLGLDYLRLVPVPKP